MNRYLCAKKNIPAVTWSMFSGRPLISLVVPNSIIDPLGIQISAKVLIVAQTSVCSSKQVSSKESTSPWAVVCLRPLVLITAVNGPYQRSVSKSIDGCTREENDWGRMDDAEFLVPPPLRFGVGMQRLRGDLQIEWIIISDE